MGKHNNSQVQAIKQREQAERERKDISNMFRQAARNKTMVQKHLNQCMDYENMMNELHTININGENNELLARCKKMIYKYQKVPELISNHLKGNRFLFSFPLNKDFVFIIII